jgi:tRNA (cmo5U34)-methyltransferase
MTSEARQDRIYSTILDEVGDFQFDRRVAAVFPDMIRRSVPGYASVINMTGVLASRYVEPGSNCYDLGCSLGASSVAMARGIAAPGCRIIGVDNSPEMLKQARQQILAGLETAIELIHGDVCDTPIDNASMVVLNFTLQFIPPEKRLPLLERIHQGLRPGGILVLSEKIRFEDPEQERLQIEMHHAFKRANGYNDLEISQKRTALEKVLIPETLAQHQQRLRQAGFRRADLWFQCFNFASLVARR